MNDKINDKMNKLRKYIDISAQIVLAVMGILIVAVVAAIVFVVSPEPYNVSGLGGGWTDEGGNSFKLSEFNGYDGTQMLPQRVYRHVEVTEADSSVIFRCRNCYVDVYIDGELVHEDKVNDLTLYGVSPGSRWHVISLGVSDGPVEICLEVTACFPKSKGHIDNIYMGLTQNVYRKIIGSRIIGFVISCFLHLVGAFIIILYAYLKKRHMASPDLLYLGLATFFSAQWSGIESLLWQLFLGYSELFHILGYLSLSAIPLGFGLLAAYRLKGRAGYLSQLFSLASAVNLIVITVLHVTGVMEFHDTLHSTHVLLALLIPVMILIVLSYTEDNNRSINNMMIFGLLFVLVICLITSLGKYISGSYGDYSSYVSIALLCFLSCLIIYQINQLTAAFSRGLKADMLHDMALTDHMTGMYNRTALNEHTPDYNHSIESFSPLGVIQFDVNNLKKVNDTLGHEKGDQMIKAVAEGLRLAFGSEGCKTYRTGGDEFLTIICNLNPDAVYQNGIRTLQEYCDAQNKLPDLGFKLYIAHGYVLVKGNKALTEAMEEADALMYENKREIKRQQNDNTVR